MPETKKSITSRVSGHVVKLRTTRRNQLAHYLCTFYDANAVVHPDTGAVITPARPPPNGVDIEAAASEVRLGAPIPEWAVSFKEEMAKHPQKATWYGLCLKFVILTS